VLVLCIALEARGWSAAKDPLQALACTAIQSRSGAPRSLSSFFWRDPHRPPQSFAGIELEFLPEAWSEPTDGPPAGRAGGAPLAGAVAQPGQAATDGAVGPGGSWQDALRRFVEWIATLPREAMEPVLLSGFAVARDLVYLTDAFVAVGCPCPFSAHPLDIRSLAMGVLSLPWEETAPDRLSRLLGSSAAQPALHDEVAAEATICSLVMIQLLDRLRRRAASEAAFR